MALKKATKGSIITVVVIAAAAVVMVIALVNILDIFGTYKRDADAYQELRAYAPIPSMDDDLPDPRRFIDFDALLALNGDVVGWITINDTNIDYPIVQGANNEYYIFRGIDRVQNKAGAIFMDCYNEADFSDQNTIIYGHNMKDGSMFADLHRFETPSFFLDHPYVHIYTPDGEEAVYRIFATFATPEDADAYKLRFGGGEAFLSYIDDARSGASISDPVEINEDDRIITLSTCIQGQDTLRHVVQAVKVSGLSE